MRAGFDFAFSPTLSWVNLIQYDNVSEVAGINMRLHWIPEAGREVFFVINHNVEDLDRDNEFPLGVLGRDREGQLHLSLLMQDCSSRPERR